MIDKLRQEFEKIYFSNISTTKGLENLALNIGVSKNSLRRFLGKIKNDSQLRISTLNLISERLGYRNFQDFCNSSEGSAPILDFDLLDIYYGIVKGKGTTLNETRFQNANYYFSKKILSHPGNLKEFLKRFAGNEEALEYVLAWHPSYEHIANEDYQEALLKMAKMSSKAHIRVFAYAFVYFGKFMSQKLEMMEADKLLQNLEKQVPKMRKESGFMVFPEARYTIAKCIHSAQFSGAAENKTLQSGFQLEHAVTDLSFGDQLIYTTYVSNILNMLKDNENADLLLSWIPSDKKLKLFSDENFHLKTHVYLYRITRAITLFHLGRKKECLAIFEGLSFENNDIRTFSFDSQIYFELQYYFLGCKLHPKRRDFKEKFELLVQKTQFTYLRKA
ncbi:MAG: hypothetical protein K0M63_11260 [Weeksellaceae bacterium]|nr:hypothetical protein [Weeksellaceae bacterium]